VRRGDVAAVYSLRRGAAEALEAVARGDAKNSQVVGRRIDELVLPEGAQIGALVRGVEDDENPRVIIPHRDTVITGGDHVVIFLPRKRMVRQIEKLFQPSATFFF
jgi:trk system potassium uptake protein TrkA